MIRYNTVLQKEAFLLNRTLETSNTTVPGNMTSEGSIIVRHFLKIYQWIDLRMKNHPENDLREEA